LVSYPQLSLQEQKTLPTLKQAAIALPVLFEDSSHQLWHCDTVDGPMMLKVCHQQNIVQSSFWRGMNQLFKADFPDNLQHIATTYQHIASISPLTIPRFIAAGANSFILASWLKGDTLTSGTVTDKMVIQLAEHLGQCHRQSQTTWGPFHLPDLSTQLWPIRLSETITTLAEHHPTVIPENILAEALQQAQSIQVDQFVPIMPDLRWDQFLQQDGQLSALVDLDAFVYGPQALDLVLVEYLLNDQQATIFKQHYQAQQVLSDLAKTRLAYRLLLFLMNVLGEPELATWMAQSHRLDPIQIR